MGDKDLPRFAAGSIRVVRCLQGEVAPSGAALYWVWGGAPRGRALERPRQMDAVRHEAALAKVLTGVAGLDDVLRGGFPAGRTTVIAGGPGSGKTVLSLQSLAYAARGGGAGYFRDV